MVKTFLFIASTITIFLVTGCKKELLQEDQATVLAAHAGNTHHTTTSISTFAAVANVASCTGGYNIRFSGPIEVMTHAVYAGGVTQTYIRQWSIKGLTATTWNSLNASNGSQLVGTVSKTYEVVAGHEMFAVQGPATYSGIGMPTSPLITDVFIHQGTIVLQNVNDPKDRLVVRHQIVKTPNDKTPRMGWYINGQLCGM